MEIIANEIYLEKVIDLVLSLSTIAFTFLYILPMAINKCARIFFIRYYESKHAFGEWTNKLEKLKK